MMNCIELLLQQLYHYMILLLILTMFKAIKQNFIVSRKNVFRDVFNVHFNYVVNQTQYFIFWGRLIFSTCFLTAVTKNKATVNLPKAARSTQDGGDGAVFFCVILSVLR